MKIPALIFALFTLIGCDSETIDSAEPESNSQYQMTESRVSSSLDRLENDEVVCYKYHGFRKGGLWCFQKKPSINF